MNKFTPKCFLYPYVRFLNTLPDSGGFDFYKGNTLIAAGLPFGAFSSYIKAETGPQIFKVTKSGNKNSVCAQLAIDLKVGSVYSICAMEEPGGMALYAINEPTERESLQYGHIRICNLSKFCKAADVWANDECIVSDIRYLEVSKYLATIPGKYTIKVKSSDDSSVFLTIPSQIVSQGKYNSLYILGGKSESPEPLGVFTIDAASYNGYYL